MPVSQEPHSLLVVSSNEKCLQFLLPMLSSSEFSPIISATDCGEARRLMTTGEYDIVVINTPLKDEFGADFSISVAGSSSAGVMLMVKSEIYDHVAEKVEKFGVFTVPKPSSRDFYYRVLKLMVATRERLRNAENKSRSLEAKMEEIRFVNRAKWLLIKYLSMSEEQAHRYIEKQAMDLRTTRREIAQNIIRTYES